MKTQAYKTSENLFHGLKIVSRVEKPEPGSDRWNELTWAIGAWRKASLGTGQNMSQCENAARELEIEREHGLVVHINKRIESAQRDFSR